MADHDDKLDIDAIKGDVGARAKRASDQMQGAAAEIGDAASQALQERVGSLREQLAALTKQVESFAGGSAHDVRDLASSMSVVGTRVARRARRSTQAAVDIVREDPVPSIFVLGIIALLAALFVARRLD